VTFAASIVRGLRATPRWLSVVLLVVWAATIFTFSAQPRNLEPVTDEYQIEITVPLEFPRAVPAVRETAGRIPPTYHTLADGTLCLGSPTRLRLIASESRTLPRFVERCVIPYLVGRTSRSTA
jgi:hypothetical protein